MEGGLGPSEGLGSSEHGRTSPCSDSKASDHGALRSELRKGRERVYQIQAVYQPSKPSEGEKGWRPLCCHCYTIRLQGRLDLQFPKLRNREVSMYCKWSQEATNWAPGLATNGAIGLRTGANVAVLRTEQEATNVTRNPHVLHGGYEGSTRRPGR